MPAIAFAKSIRRRLMAAMRKAHQVLGFNRRNLALGLPSLGGRLRLSAAVVALSAPMSGYIALSTGPALAGYAEAGASYNDSSNGTATSGSGNFGGTFGSGAYGVILAGDNDIVAYALPRLTLSAANVSWLLGQTTQATGVANTATMNGTVGYAWVGNTPGADTIFSTTSAYGFNAFAAGGGADVEVTWSAKVDGYWCDGVARGAAVVISKGRTIEKPFDGVEKVTDAPFHAKARAAGAVWLGYLGMPGEKDRILLALDGATGERLKAAEIEARSAAKEISADLETQRRANLRATQTIHRVLRYSPHWGGYALDEGFDAPEGGYTRRVFSALPGAEERLHQKCPSIDAITRGRSHDAEFCGHENYLWILTDDEVDALRRETAELDAQDDLARGAAVEAEQARLARLKETRVPDDAIAAFRRHKGNADRAWEQDDERGCMLIRHYGEAIELQGIAVAEIGHEMAEIHPPGA